MNNTHINSNTQATPTSAGAFTMLKFVFGLSFLLGAGVLAPSQALAWHCDLSISPTTIQSGQSATLTWSSALITTLSIDNGIGNVTPVSGGSVSVSPTANTTYTGSGTSPDGPVTCTTTIVVTPPPAPTCTLSASPTTIKSGDSSTLSWTTTNSTSFTIDNSVGSVTPVDSGTKSVSPTTDTTYTGTAKGPGGSVTCTTKVKVTPPPSAPTCTLSANPASINSGDSSTLSWTTTNSTSFTLDNSIGSVTPVAAGTSSVSPTTTTTYTGTATGPGGTVTCTTTVTVTPPVCTSNCGGGGGGPPPLACTLTANPTSINSGDSSTLSWTTTSATSFSIDNNIGTVTPVAAGSTSTAPITTTTTYTGLATGPSGTVTCQATVTIPPPVTGCTSNCGGGGGGGGPSTPSVVLSLLPHVGNQPLAYLYLSQIPYTGLDLGSVGTVVYWAALIAWALALAYLVLFGVAPAVNRFFRNLGARVTEVLNTQEPVYAGVPQRMSVAAPVTPVAPRAPAPVIRAQEPQEAPRGYSSYDGFKSFAHNGSLSIDDIVKGLARTHAAPVAAVEPKRESIQYVEPVYDHVEPIYENIEPIMEDSAPEVASAAAPVHIRGFVAALVQGDRSAVFAGLRQYTRGGGAPEKLISETACLLDDSYRARLDGTSADADITRLVARLDTPTLEKLVASLTTAIDSSYTAGVTGAKIALTRALGTLGA